MKPSNRQRAVLAFLALILPFLVACSGRDYREVMKQPEELFYKGEYKEAARLLLPEINKSGPDQLLFMMEGGYMLHAAADYKNSNMVFIRAGKLAEVKPISLSQQVASLFANERLTNYRGEDYEKVLVHMYAGINFLVLNDIDSARVEFKAVNEQLARVKTDDGRKTYKQNIMAKYLTALCYEIIGDRDKNAGDLEFAYIEMKQIMALNPNFGFVATDLLRIAKKLNYDDDYRNWMGVTGQQYDPKSVNGELVMFFEAGRSAIKASRGKLLQDPTMRPLINAQLAIAIASRAPTAAVSTAIILGTMNEAENPIPVLIARNNQVSHLRILVNGVPYRTIELENISATALNTLNENYPKLAQKVAASIAVKAVTTYVAGMATKEAVRRSSGNSILGELAGLFAGGVTGAALFSSMKPDLRCWHTLPSSLQIARINLPPGNYTVTTQLVGYNGAVMSSRDRQVVIGNNSRVVLTERSID